MEKDIIEMNIADTIMEKPIGFGIGRRRFFLYPPTLGKNYLLARIIKQLGIRTDILSTNPYLEALRLATENKGLSCRLIALHSFSKKRDICDESKVCARQKFFARNLDREELAQLLIMVLTLENVQSYISFFGLDKEQDERKRVMKVKEKSNRGSVSFGGKSTYGTLIDFACERYGWTMDYVVWGISYANLQMLMADAISTIYLSEEEQKKLGVENGRIEVINAEDPNNYARIASMLKD